LRWWWATSNREVGTLIINKARVAGIDKHLTKTGDDRRVVLCPRALNVLNSVEPMRSGTNAGVFYDRKDILLE
jgi:hypothetical protein